MKITPIKRLGIAAAAIVAIACGGDSGTGPSDTVAGTYSLSSYNGKPLSFTLADTVGTDIYTTTYLAPFTLSLNSDKTLKIVITVNFAMNGQGQVIKDSTFGSWSQSGNVVTLTTEDGPSTATWNGSNTLTINDPPDVLVFSKQ